MSVDPVTVAILNGRLEQIADVLTAAQERGQLPDTTNCALAAVVLTGPLFHQHLLMQDTIGDELIDEITSQFVGAHSSA